MKPIYVYDSTAEDLELLADRCDVNIADIVDALLEFADDIEV